MNAPTLLFSSKECDIYYNQELEVVQTRWKGIYVSGNEFRKILDEIINALAVKKVSTIIADARNMKVIGEADRQWIIDDWYPRALEAGFRCQALVVTKDTFNEQAIKLIVMKYNDDDVKTRYFTAPEDAEAWVKSGALVA
jgi:hypothetical protein